MKEPIPELKAGDILLYNDTSIVDRLICFRTWSDVAHIEIYMGDNQSSASRNGIGVGMYPFRLLDLKYVRRPNSFNFNTALDYFKRVDGMAYGWLDLLRFYGVGIVSKGLICSQFADQLLQAGGCSIFDTEYDAAEISPRDFKISPNATTIWKAK